MHFIWVFFQEIALSSLSMPLPYFKQHFIALKMQMSLHKTLVAPDGVAKNSLCNNSQLLPSFFPILLSSVLQDEVPSNGLAFYFMSIHMMRIIPDENTQLGCAYIFSSRIDIASATQSNNAAGVRNSWKLGKELQQSKFCKTALWWNLLLFVNIWAQKSGRAKTSFISFWGEYGQSPIK